MIQPSTWVGAISAGAIGAATASVLSLATAMPPAKHASISRIRVAQRGRPLARPKIQAPSRTAAPSATGQVVGSAFRVKYAPHPAPKQTDDHSGQRSACARVSVTRLANNRAIRVRFPTGGRIRPCPMDAASMTSPSSTVVTRFAPSPPGYLHIGGARTAIFNWLYAKGRGGKFLIRIEDTDRERSTDEAVKAIFGGLSWLELFGDEEPVFQFARADRHREVVNELLATGHAYRDFLTADETTALRDQAKAEGR